MPRSYQTIELSRQKAGMGERLGKKDPEYTYYAGGNFATCSQIANIVTMLKAGLLPPSVIPLVKLYLTHLIQQRKAFFVTVDSDVVTKLGVLLGMKDDTIRY